MKVLIACEFSGRVRDAFIKRGHDAWSCDILPTDVPGPHIQGDVMEVIDRGWDMIVAHPPCTYLCNSGVQWLHRDRPSMTKEQRWELMTESATFFRNILNSDIPKKVLENPVMHKYAIEIIGRKQDQIVKPSMFGDNANKQTCLWLENLPRLKPTNIITATRYTSGSGKQYDEWWFKTSLISDLVERSKVRSTTFPGIADAMAEQWG